MPPIYISFILISINFSKYSCLLVLLLNRVIQTRKTMASAADLALKCVKRGGAEMSDLEKQIAQVCICFICLTSQLFIEFRH